MSEKLNLKGIDVSTWQGSGLDFKKLKKAGVNFAILRAGFGAGKKDNQFENNYSKAKAAKMPVGAYWYSYALSAEQAREEAKACIKILEGKQFEYPIYFDLEDKTQWSLTKSVKTAMIVAFCEELENAGYFAGVYSSLSWLRNELEYDKIKRFTIWLAQWYKEPTYEKPFAMWQYGVDKFLGMDIDANICYEDFPTIIKDAGLNGYPKPEAPKEETPTEESKDPEPTPEEPKPADPSPTKKPVTEEIVLEVIRGNYGVGKDRFNKLEAEGYDSKAVQDAVNEYLKKMNSNDTKSDLKIGDRVKIKPGSVWTDGQKVPAWVTTMRMYVRSSVKNGTVWISTMSTGAKTGCAYVKDLIKD